MILSVDGNSDDAMKVVTSPIRANIAQMMAMMSNWRLDSLGIIIVLRPLPCGPVMVE